MGLAFALLCWRDMHRRKATPTGRFFLCLLSPRTDKAEKDPGDELRMPGVIFEKDGLVRQRDLNACS